MFDNNKSDQKCVNVDKLLRLKRSERPNQGFWDTFDRELHQRMLQTLVKKDPWYLQLLSAFTGRTAQTLGVGAVTVLLALIMIRPTIMNRVQTENVMSLSQEKPEVFSSDLSLIAIQDAENTWVPDYQIEVISAQTSTPNLGFTPDYSYDSIEVVAYDSSAYSIDTASFALTGLAAGLVY